MRATHLAWLVASSLLLACSSVGGGSGPRPTFDDVKPPKGGERFPNWIDPPITSLEQLQELNRSRVEVESVKGAGGGVTGASKEIVYYPTLREQLKLKVKRVPVALDGWNNSPRKELAADAVQQLFLDPEDFPVPSSGLRCVPTETWEKNHGEKVDPSIPGTRCLLVSLSFWMKDITLPDPLYDEQRFASDPVYAYHLANFNTLTYLIDHRDNRTGNFLVSSNDADRRVYAIDNGISFGAWIFNWFYPSTYAWRKIQVTALPKQTVERLRSLARGDLDTLATVAQLEDDGSGILRVVAPTTPFDPEKGVRVKGTTVQFGLTEHEIDDVWQRIEELLEAIDEDELGTF